MSDDWKEYPNNRLCREVEGVKIIVPKSRTDLTPFFCSVCSFVMRTSDDERAYREFGCCERCSLLWAAPNRQKWNEGWRPSDEQVKAANSERLPLSTAIKLE